MLQLLFERLVPYLGMAWRLEGLHVDSVEFWRSDV